MKPTLVKNILRMIKATKSRFLSLTAIVALGVAFFIGVYSSSTVMDKSVDVYDDTYHLKDITVYSNYGFRQEDIDAIEDLEDISVCEGSYFVDVIASQDERSNVTRVHSYSEDSIINQFKLTEGRMPENEHEALAESGTTITKGFAIGTTVTLSRPDNDLDTYMKEDTVTIVGMIDTPVYMNMTKENSTLSNRPITTYLYVPEEAFCCEYYLEADALTTDGASYDAFSDEYFEYCADVKAEVEELAETQQQENFQAIKQKALEEYNDGLREYRDGEEEFRTKIAEAEQKLKDAEAEIASGKQTLEDSIQQLLDGEKELEEQEASGRAQIEDGRIQIQDGLRQIDDGITQLQTLKTQREQVLSAQQQVQDAEAMLKKLKAVLQLVPEDTAVKDLISVIDTDGSISSQLSQLDTDWQNKTAGELLSSVNEKLQSLQSTSALLEDSRKQIDDGILAIASDSEKTAIEQAEAELSAAQSDTESLEEEIAVLEALDQYLPEEYDDVKIDVLMEHQEEILDLLNRIPFDEISSYQNVDEVFDAADAKLAELLEQETDAQRIEVLTRIRERMQEIRKDIPEQIQNMDFSLYSTYGKTLVQVIERLGLNADGSVHTVGDLRSRVSAQLQENRQELETKKQTQTAAEKKAAEAYEAVIDRKILDLQKQRKEVEAKSAELDTAEETLNTQIAQAKQTIADGWAEVTSGQQELEDAQKQLDDGKSELETSREDGQKELDEAWQKLLDAKKTIDDLEDGEWTVLDRKQHYATVTYDATIDQMAAIGKIFPLFFLMVAILVCLTTMARTVDEQRGEIGILRALGYTRLQCAGKYLIYSASATILGELIGVVVGMCSFPIVIYNTWKMMYILPEIKIAVQWGLVALTDLAFLAVMLATTWFACSRDMNDVPAQLLRPKSPRLGKNMILERITFLWKRISFTWKVTIRNIVRYKSRFIMTVAGVAGCTALLVTGFGIKDSISGMVDLQFSQITQYDGLAMVEDTLTNTEAEELRKQIENREDVEFAMLFYNFTSEVYESDGTSESIKIQVYENCEDIANTYALRTRKGHDPLQLTDDGAVISEKLAERAGVSVGDELTVEDEEGRKHTVTVAAITEMYIQHYVFMSETYYEETIGEKPVSRCIAIDAADADDMEELKKDLAEMKGVSGIEFYDTTLERFSTMVKSLDIIVWTIIISSMALAFVVLGNLINVNISERQREIATLKVLGFRRKEVESYIYKENNILTFFGALAGVPLGIWLHSKIMRTVEMDYVMFGRSVSTKSMIISVLLTVLFGELVNISMKKRLHSIQMVESLKSVE